MTKKKIVWTTCTPGETVFDALKDAGVSYSRIGGFANNPRPNEEVVARVRVRTSESHLYIYAKK